MLNMKEMTIANAGDIKSPKQIVIFFSLTFLKDMISPELADAYIETHVRETDALCGLLRLTSARPEHRNKHCSYDYVSKHNDTDENRLCESESIIMVSGESQAFVAIGLQCAKLDMVDELILLEKQLTDLVEQNVIKSFSQENM